MPVTVQEPTRYGEVINLPIGHIKVTLWNDDKGNKDGSVESRLHDLIPYPASRAIEEMVLRCACNNVDIDSPEFILSLKAAMYVLIQELNRKG